MNLNNVLATVGKMFPSANLNEAVQKAEEALSGTANSLDSVSATARRLGLNRQSIEDIYSRFGSTMQGRAVCGLLGTTPEALKADAEKILGGGAMPPAAAHVPQAGTTRFPRLK